MHTLVIDDMLCFLWMDCYICRYCSQKIIRTLIPLMTELCILYIWVLCVCILYLCVLCCVVCVYTGHGAATVC